MTGDSEGKYYIRCQESGSKAHGRQEEIHVIELIFSSLIYNLLQSGRQEKVNGIKEC